MADEELRAAIRALAVKPESLDANPKEEIEALTDVLVNGLRESGITTLSMRSRQERLEADLQRAWSQDPLALMGFAQPEKGTKKVHEKRERPN